MAVPEVFESEYRFCLILWKNEPTSRTKLAKLCNEELGWSRTTTYTVIKQLSDRGCCQKRRLHRFFPRQ
ncbi:BlaI/MecI/CopY family transcriptional regulator [Thermoclostridium stercorarium]|uniref:BlaI/MecI/CopY family transcriptional regulator n=1 Tax=Thermoclostridium stercorarium TaxID=1510 RepID=UPI00202A74E4|nr:BlaI/MecI/CopY family transcriptional regulator [Thermoclostridium stercorarium]UZQ84886.1 BlaI/MecI/CopY family transcriptional regulator [Thermoclostridium stercorarium]